MKKSIFLIALVTLCFTWLFAQDLTPPGSLNLNLDYARFRYDEQLCYLEIYYSFYPFQLTYNLLDGKYTGGVKLFTRLTNNKTKKLAIDEQTSLPIVINDTTEASFRYPFISQAGYALPLGEYTLQVMAADSINPSRQDSISLPVSLQGYPDKLVCSDLELCSNVKSSSKKDDPFSKNSLEVIPNATLIFGVTAHPVIFHYLELYHLNPDETYTVKTLIKDFQGKIIRESSKSRKYGVRNTTEVGMTNVTSIVSGKYNYCIELSDKKSHVLTQTKKAFYIYNPHLQAKPVTTPSIQESEFAGLSGDALSNEFRQAKYMATEEEIKIFKQIDSETGKREFLVKFWTEVEKGRFDYSPIKRAQYLHLIEVANENYREMGKEGWRTDRGRVYILYGKPDDIERFPSLGESKPYEIWRYHRIESGVEFVFIDRLGYGYYELVHSTKRGELWNDDWEDYLR
ncbi:GWxTD domain-containing protein [candidate division KSB1 bacterium]|nr:GWxTD domain-containing protein [candidate division KSB1 bacterium]